MIRICLTTVALALLLFFTFRAEAKQPTARVVGTSSLAPAMPIVMLMRPLPPVRLLVPGPDEMLIRRVLEGQRSRALLRSSDDRSRDGMLRELAMTTREDASLYAVSAHMSAWGVPMPTCLTSSASE